MPVSTEASLSALCLQLQAGELSATDLIDACLDRIDADDEQLKAWAYVARDEARAEADTLDRGFTRQGRRGPLHGIPFGVKDIFDTAAIPTEWGSPQHRGRVPAEDSAIVWQLRDAGAVVLGKTHTTAYAYFDPAPTRNPHNPAHTPGGSSSGSAAAVAAGMVPFALGSQTMGSVLRPASFCGVVGFKPSFDRLPLGGVMPFAKSLDHAGLFTRTVADMRHLWTAMSAEAQADSSGEPPKFINVPWPIEDGLEPEMEAGFDELLTRLRSAGIEIEQRPLPESFPDLLRAARAINNYEGARENRRRYEEHGAAIGTKLAALVEDGLAMPEATYHQAQETVAMTRDVFETSVRDGALWLVPSAPGRAPEGLATTGDPRCNAPFTAMGVPALSLPFKRTAEGLPLGCQIVGPNGGEALVLAAAGHCEVLLREAAAAG